MAKPDRCPLCGESRLGGWGVYADMFACRTYRLELGRVVQHAVCRRIAAMKAVCNAAVLVQVRAEEWRKSQLPPATAYGPVAEAEELLWKDVAVYRELETAQGAEGE